jgi:hypothetical protein
MAYEIYEAETDSVELCSEAVDVEWLISSKKRSKHTFWFLLKSQNFGAIIKDRNS